jgi:hypothetical protein
MLQVNLKLCILDDTKNCLNCGDCLQCDLDPKKICDNCCQCLETSLNDYETILIDEIIQ